MEACGSPGHVAKYVISAGTQSVLFAIALQATFTNSSTKIEAFSLGVYTPIFGASLCALLFSKSQKRLCFQLAVITTALYALSAGQIALTFWQSIISTDLMPHGSYQDDASMLSEVTRFYLGSCIGDTMTACSNLLADCLLPREACGFAVVAFDIERYLARLHSSASQTEFQIAHDYLGERRNAVAIAFFVSSFITNLLMSSLVAHRIWSATRRLAVINRSRRNYMRLASYIFETGILYSITLLLCAIFLQTKDDVPWLTAPQNATFGVSSQIVGIFPTIIILLVALGRTFDQTIDSVDSDQLTTVPVACLSDTQPSDTGEGIITAESRFGSITSGRSRMDNAKSR
ncbi:hypothetical protein OE88DRAFT_1757484 [Heliocybe sulcata]|uniref:Uncharacterized protein n=1 Tax=Heliocybe sulcata TaxID=5364 RepID=A0A5C3MX91_9AGAM|nr:hypothetical protein OE88DRAFT_1757484 [Heliocybe sulcata]